MRLTRHIGVVAAVVAALGLVAGAAQAHWNLEIDRAMDAIGLRAGMVVGEAGAGDGYFTLPMARRVGPTGLVCANDISARALGLLENSARRESLSNITTVTGSTDDPRFPRKDFDLIVLVHAFHDFDQPVAWLVNAKKYLKPGATVAIIDEDPGQGASSHFWPRDRITGYARDAGYSTVKIVEIASRHLVVILAPHQG